MLLKRIVIVNFLFFAAIGFSQKKEVMNASMSSTATYMREIGPLSGKKLLPGKPREGKINPRGTAANKIVPGKGFPKGIDPLLVKQKNRMNKRAGKAPSLTFEANKNRFSPSDPTGAIGPNHYVSAKNFDFAIHDRAGAVLVQSASLTNIFPNEDLGDPIVFYDSFANRFVVTQFDGDPENPNDPQNGFLVAVCKGPDPVNDGWFTYRFNTGSFPDYTKFSIWSDGYYITSNKNPNSIETSEVVFVIEREKMLRGEEDAKIVGFPLPGARTGRFYSPASFNALGNALPPDGGARIVLFQDDEWQGVDQDILKLWEINVNWVTPSQSTINEAEELVATPFDSTFDGGSFGNIPQPGTDGQDIDVLQGAVMYATNYRRFCDYNAVVLNFAVDIDTNADNISGIRWYELRQNGDGQPWTVFQEGTYASPDGKSAWCGSMAMDVFGNIGLAYTTMGTITNGATEDSFASIRYTGRLADDILGTMTFTEEIIAIGTGLDQTDANRYGDYAQLTVDPVDDQTFWHIAEYFIDDPMDYSRNVVGVFKIAEDVASDVGVVSVDVPEDDATFTNNETITVTLKNFGSSAQSDISVSYTINGGPEITELFAGPIAPGATAAFSFATVADFTAERRYTITTETNLASDINPENDCADKTLNNLFTIDVGVGELVTPSLGSELSVSPEAVTVTLYNYSSAPVTNIPVFYVLNNGTRTEEVFEGTIQPQEEVTYTFTTFADVVGIGNFEFLLGTTLNTDQNTANDTITRLIERVFCRPTSDCARFRDGITSFELENVSNTTIPCDSGYNDFTNDFTIVLNKSVAEYTLIVQSGFANSAGAERFSLWIDFNDNNIFETSELLLDNQIITEEDTDQSFTFSLNGSVPVGRHILRIRGGDTATNFGALLNNTCGSMDFGSTHDYTVEIVQVEIKDTDLTVLSQPDNQFLITKVEAGAPQELRIYVFNILGQIIASNKVTKDGGNKFTYELDMSFAKSGIYFARFGDRKKDAKGFFVR